MKPNFLGPTIFSYVGGLGFIVGTLMVPTASQAQGFCYMVNTDGQVINLDELCQSNNSPTPGQTQGAGVTSTPAASQSSSSSTSYTIVGPSANPGASSDPRVTNPTTNNPATTNPAATGPATTGPATTGPQTTVEPMDESMRPGIPVRAIPTPTIQVPQVPQPQEPVDVTSPSSRPVNGTVTGETTREIIVSPDSELVN